MELQAIAEQAPKNQKASALPYEIRKLKNCYQLDFSSMWASLFKQIADGIPLTSLANQFHYTLALASVGMIERLQEQFQFESVVLSGGVFQNKLLLEYFNDELAKNGLKVLAQQNVPSNDGGIALGQVAIAYANKE